MIKLSFSQAVKLWIKYFNIFSSGHPLLMYPNYADCIIAQTFGRTMYEDKDISAIIACLPTRTDTIGSLEGLMKLSFDSGKPNVEIAKACYFYLEKYGTKKLYAQWEVAFEMFKLDREKYIHLRKTIIPIWPDVNTKSFTSNDLLKQIKGEMKKYHLEDPLLIANNWMSIRAALLIKKRIGTYPVLAHLNCNSFNPQSTQKWTRNYICWISKESLVRIHHYVLRWV